MTDVNLALIPQAVVSGKIMDQDGDPLNGARVGLLQEQWVRGKQRYYSTSTQTAPTNDRGEYRIANLSPGKYYLYVQKTYFGPDPVNQAAASGKPDIRPVGTFYPQAANISEAAPLELKAGQDLSGMDIRLRSAPTYHIRGKIAGPMPQDESARLTVLASPRDEEISYLGGSQSTVDSKGTFDLPGVIPDKYTVTLIRLSPESPVRGLSRQAVDVGSADVDDVVLTIVPSLTVRGQIRIEGNLPPGASPPALTNARVSLGVVGRMFAPGMPPHATAADGSFIIENVFPAKYYLRTYAPAGTYVKSVRFEEQELLGKELDLSQGSAGELEVVLRYGPAEVDGTVQAGGLNTSVARASPPPYATVVLVPKMNPETFSMRYSNTNQDGDFSVKQVPPGVYRAYAFEDMKVDELQNPDILRELGSRGVELDLRENDKKQLQLTMIPAEEMKQILARLNIGSN